MNFERSLGLSDKERERLFRMDHELIDETEDAYYERKATAIASGAPTWWVYNFESDGRVYGFWLNRSEWAFVEDDSSGEFRVYVRNPIDANGGIPLDDDSTMLRDAGSLIEAVDVAERQWGLTN